MMRSPKAFAECIRHCLPVGRKCISAALICLSLLLQTRPATAHPHVFVDARIDFVMGGSDVLQALQITWRFDLFHTLYILSFDGISPMQDGGLSSVDQDALSASYTEWQNGFDGFAKLFSHGDPVALAPPSAVRAGLQDGQLEISFTRLLRNPMLLQDGKADLAIYDATYYHAITISAPPRIHGNAQGCHASVIPFEPERLTTFAQAELAKLENEQSPAVDNVGQLFADRITLSCD